MPTDDGMELFDMVSNAGRIMEQAVNQSNPDVKKALRDAARILLQSAIARMDESVGATVSLEDDYD